MLSFFIKKYKIKVFTAVKRYNGSEIIIIFHSSILSNCNFTEGRNIKIFRANSCITLHKAFNNLERYNILLKSYNISVIITTLS
jgi:hypothetical protein